MLRASVLLFLLGCWALSAPAHALHITNGTAVFVLSFYNGITEIDVQTGGLVRSVAPPSNIQEQPGVQCTCIAAINGSGVLFTSGDATMVDFMLHNGGDELGSAVACNPTTGQVVITATLFHSQSNHSTFLINMPLAENGEQTAVEMQLPPFEMTQALLQQCAVLDWHQNILYFFTQDFASLNQTLYGVSTLDGSIRLRQELGNVIPACPSFHPSSGRLYGSVIFPSKHASRTSFGYFDTQAGGTFVPTIKDLSPYTGGIEGTINTAANVMYGLGTLPSDSVDMVAIDLTASTLTKLFSISDEMDYESVQFLNPSQAQEGGRR